MIEAPKVSLAEGIRIPVIGLGTWQLSGDICYRTVSSAIEIGYRHFDTANIYGNQVEIGKAVKESGLSRSEIFLTSKVWWSELKRERLIEAINRTLEELNSEYVDLYLIHWPNREVSVKETLETMEEIRNEGLIRAIGVANFTRHHLEDALATGVNVVNNQVEFHPSLNQEDLRKFCENNGITVTAYSPLAQGEDLKLPQILKIAKAHQVTASQVILSWMVQKGIVVIPRSVRIDHLRDNLLSLELKLNSDEVAEIDKLNNDNRTVNLDVGEFDY